MSGIMFRYLISMAANMNLKMPLTDVVTTYLYGSPDSEIYMKVPEGLKIPGPNESEPQYVQRPPATVVIWVETIRKDVVQSIE